MNKLSIKLLTVLSLFITTHEIVPKEQPSLVMRALTEIKDYAFPKPPSHNLHNPHARICGKGDPMTQIAKFAMKTKDELADDRYMTITDREIEDLMLDYVFKTFERASTTFGYATLAQSKPITDLERIKLRQELLHLLTTNDELFNELRTLLNKINEYSLDILSYYADHKKLSQDKSLHNAADANFLWHLPLRNVFATIKIANNYLNTHAAPLEIGARWATNLKPLKSFYAGVLGMNFAMSFVTVLIRKKTDNWSLSRELFDPIYSIFLDHFPGHKLYDKNEYDRRAALCNNSLDAAPLHRLDLLEYTKNIFNNGSLFDKATARARGYGEPSSSVALFDKDSWLGTAFDHNQTWLDDHYLHYVYRFGKWLTDLKITIGEENGRIKSEEELTPWSKFWNGYFPDLVPLAISDYFRISSATEAVYDYRKNNAILSDLRAHMMRIKSFFATVTQLQKVVQKIESELAAELVNKLSVKTAAKNSEPLAELLNYLKCATFTGSEDAWFYKESNVLFAHLAMKKAKSDLAPLLQAIGQIDAYVATATLIRQSRATNIPWCIANFEQADTPFIKLNHCWVPLIDKNHVPNDFYFGGTDQPNNILLTGPNGGGKSSVIKAVGIAVYCAHAWGGVSAEEAVMAPIDQMITCLRSEENIFENMSTFMAALQDINQVKQRVRSVLSKQKKCLLLIDEPYRGTVDTEAAERLYEFCHEIIKHPMITMIATHLEKPTKIEAETNGLLTNYFVKISEVPGGFKREYTLQRGLCEWWFNDAQKRRNFIDWLALIDSKAAKSASAA